MSFSLDQFVADGRAAAAKPNALQAADALMVAIFSDPQAIASSMPPMEEDEVILFEDDSVSIWHERFLPTGELPPHDHQLSAVIGVYHGMERNRLFRKSGGRLVEAGSLVLCAGQTHVFGPHDVHAVQALNSAPSLGLHIYLGPLTKVERSLFDWDSGSSLPLCEQTFEAMKRPA